MTYGQWCNHYVTADGRWCNNVTADGQWCNNVTADFTAQFMRERLYYFNLNPSVTISHSRDIKVPLVLWEFDKVWRRCNIKRQKSLTVFLSFPKKVRRYCGVNFFQMNCVFSDRHGNILLWWNDSFSWGWGFSINTAVTGTFHQFLQSSTPG